MGLVGVELRNDVWGEVQFVFWSSWSVVLTFLTLSPWAQCIAVDLHLFERGRYIHTDKRGGDTQFLSGV